MEVQFVCTMYVYGTTNRHLSTAHTHTFMTVVQTYTYNQIT